MIVFQQPRILSANLVTIAALIAQFQDLMDVQCAINRHLIIEQSY